MNPKKFSETIIKIHEAFYHKTLTVISYDDYEVKLVCENDHFGIENYIETRFRLTFPDYVGKITQYRNLFGYIMHNGDNVCDTSDFIDLSRSHVIKNL